VSPAQEPSKDFVESWLDKAETEGLNPSLVGVLRDFYKQGNFDSKDLAELLLSPLCLTSNSR
jgi:hypothetical protein